MRRALYDIAALASRIGIGGIFAAYGWRKLEAGLTVTEQQFAAAQLPAPGAMAAGAMLVELIGAALLVLGIAVPVVVLLLFAEAVGIVVLVPGPAAAVLAGDGVQLLVALGAASILLAVGGAGRASIGHLLFSRRADVTADEAEDALAGLRDESDRPTAELGRPTGSASPAAELGKLVAPLPKDPPKQSDSSL